MPSPVIHLIVPLVILLLIFKNDRSIIKYAPFALLPDLDTFSGMHRALLHNVFIIVAIALMIYFITKNEKVTKVIFIFMISHIILDMFNGGASLLFPLYNKVFLIDIGITTDTAGHIKFIFNMIKDGSPEGMWSGGTGYLIDKVDSGILFIAACVYMLRKRI